MRLWPSHWFRIMRSSKHYGYLLHGSTWKGLQIGLNPTSIALNARALSPIVATFFSFPAYLREYNTIFPRSWFTFFRIVNDQTYRFFFFFCNRHRENSFSLDAVEKERRKTMCALIIRRIINADQNQIQGSGVCDTESKCFAAGFVRTLFLYLLASLPFICIVNCLFLCTQLI